MSRFARYDNGTYHKYVSIDDDTYEVCIPADTWESVKTSVISNHIGYWIKSKKNGNNPKLKYGIANKIDIGTNSTTYCKECNKEYKTRAGFIRHKDNCNKDSKHTTQGVLTDRPLENIRTYQNTENNTNINNNTQNITNNNNIQINIVTRDFSKENPQWLTMEVFLDAILDLNTAIPKLIKAKHFNDKFPENNNIRISDRRDLKKRLKVRKNHRWAIEDRTDLTNKLMYKMGDILDDFFSYYSQEESEWVDEESMSQEDLHNRKVLGDIRRSQRAKRIITRMKDKWKEIENEIINRDEKLMEQINDRFDTILLDNELKISQLENKIKLVE